ncbi:methenyltetrahydrofolate cyclohydrolase /5,10-methylenetetrahydrofolate dehydrogenase (NADP+) [Desulfitobacterium sp. LBE]|uniref:Bifunctional protein FolD 2 n=3 Tax=Desulfitobacterium hafniense TaxID=49338 RepID=FOLD2_DESHY|nr:MULTISPECIES: tetrahydrofolate dehydrogenase/cyclohydrolase catalytic domain-containing protein [Desulfitobacterium]Q24UZ7.1 RecName: Full=Bifunctional protein FolD 2; Includes: RecName: Full=Methylenetetrahydrofolate dehydrogenase; Includes: RecName: Full=Methenyltetrahydrofolate cyclohydrolase [Desulfitobacterium hafniense Y51]ACL21514.1 Methylenetetrahydrofolate dehydrogenase (NADP(+)) [Desulfitobacterium hafniense DCB-2]KTE89814.1 bifunctional 5,10-methylene-tetrahydrofolate dehydrogenase
MAQLLDGKEISKVLKEEIKEEVKRWKEQGVNPKLAVVLVGDDPASVVYAKSKQKVSDSLGIDFELTVLPADSSEESILALIDSLNANPDVHGIMIELPLPKHISKERVMAAVRPDKDVDGVHPINRGYILSGEEGLFPATPESCIEIMLRSGVEIAGKHVVIVGRGETVGKPLVFLILKHNATVTICHSRTPDLGAFTRQADIIVAAVGKAKLVKKDMVKPGAIVVDAGINEIPGGICGDVDFEEVKEVASLISPVPGGVGSLTTALIMKNVLKGITLQRKEGQ